MRLNCCAKWGVLTLMLSGLAAFAAPITYTGQVVASGIVGNQSFVDATIILTMVGDTSNVTPGVVYSNLGTVSIDISGVGTGTLTGANTAVFVNQSFSGGTAGFGELNCCTFLGTINSVFSTYTLDTSIGPVSGSNFIRTDIDWNTSLGTLRFRSAGDSTFTATTDAVPEPSSFALLGTALGLLGYCLRRSR